MKTRKFTQLLAAFLVVLIFSCDKEENSTPPQVQRIQSENVGFTGILPDNLPFGNKNITSSNHVAGIADSVGGAAYLAHYLNIRDPEAEVNIQIKLPFRKYSNDWNPKTDNLIKDAQVHYSYEQVKNVLSPGDKTILSLQEPDSQKGFGIYVGRNALDEYSNDFYFNQASGLLRVIKLKESTEQDPIRGQLKTLYITFEVDVNLHPHNANYTEEKRFKGLLQMKYQEI